MYLNELQFPITLSKFLYSQVSYALPQNIDCGDRVDSNVIIFSDTHEPEPPYYFYPPFTLEDQFEEHKSVNGSQRCGLS